MMPKYGNLKAVLVFSLIFVVVFSVLRVVIKLIGQGRAIELQMPDYFNFVLIFSWIIIFTGIVKARERVARNYELFVNVFTFTFVVIIAVIVVYNSYLFKSFIKDVCPPESVNNRNCSSLRIANVTKCMSVMDSWAISDNPSSQVVMLQAILNNPPYSFTM
jgi:hypothetical protein